MLKVTKAVIPAAGLGTRFLPVTKSQPKEMLPIVDKPCIQYIVEEIVKSGITDITIVTGRNKRAIEDHFDYSFEMENILSKKDKKEELGMLREISEYANIYYIRQREPLGLGHAILKAKHHIGNEPFVVLLGDDIVCNEKPVVKQMLDVRSKYGISNILGVQKVPEKNVSNYGIIDPKRKLDERVMEIADFVEKPNIDEAPSTYACLGRYILEPNIFYYLENTKPGKGGEIQLTDAILNMMRDNNTVLAYDFEGERYDTGDKLGFLKANIEFALKRQEIKGNFKKYLTELINKL